MEEHLYLLGEQEGNLSEITKNKKRQMAKSLTQYDSE